MLCHDYVFFNIHPQIRLFAEKELEQAKKEFAEIIENNSEVKTFAYSLLGLKNETRIMLWFQAEAPEPIQNLISALMHSLLGEHLKISKTFFGLVRPSQYTKNPTAQEQAINENERGKYLIIYPFTKTKEWYLLSFEERKELMGEHMRVGHKFKGIRQLLLYSFGLDDQEFIVSYETENLLDFQTLVMDLRATKARLYTERDTPIFTCIHKTLPEALDVV